MCIWTTWRYIVSFILVYTWRARRGTRGCRSCHKYPGAALIISFYAIILFLVSPKDKKTCRWAIKMQTWIILWIWQIYMCQQVGGPRELGRERKLPLAGYNWQQVIPQQHHIILTNESSKIYTTFPSLFPSYLLSLTIKSYHHVALHCTDSRKPFLMNRWIDAC